MILKIPDYYEEFRCVAGTCKHSCCRSWEIDIDEDTYLYYCSIEGKFGDKLKENIQGKKNRVFKMKDGKCPFLKSDQLCEIFIELGEEGLCEVCTEYPRFVTDYQNTRERSLCMSCEEVGRLIFSKKEPVIIKEYIQPGDFETGQTESNKRFYDKDGNILRARDHCIKLLQDRTVQFKDRIKNILQLSEQVQKELDGHKKEQMSQVNMGFDGFNSGIMEKNRHQFFMRRMEVLLGMEVMEEEWEEEIHNIACAFNEKLYESLYEEIEECFLTYMEGRMQEYEHLLVYFIFRYVIQAVYDKQFLKRVKFCIACYLFIRDMDYTRFLLHKRQYTIEDRIDTARIFSRQVEHSEKCVDYLQKEISEKEAFSVHNLILQL